MSRLRTPTLSAAIVLAAIIAAPAPPAVAEQAWTFTGSTVGRPANFDRPTENGGQLGQMVAFHAQRFQLTGPAECDVISSQDYDGYLHVYQGSFDRTNPLQNHLGSNDDFPAFGITGESRVSFTGGAGTYIIVTSDYFAGNRGSFQNHVTCEDDQGQDLLFGDCNAYVGGIPQESQVCLNGFAIAIDGISGNPPFPYAVPVRMSSSDSAFFWFYNDRNFEVVVKVLDACSFAPAHPLRGYWVFAAALTNQAFQVSVRAPNGVQRTVYANPQFNPATALTRAPEFDESFCP